MNIDFTSSNFDIVVLFDHSMFYRQQIGHHGRNALKPVERLETHKVE